MGDLPAKLDDKSRASWSVGATLPLRSPPRSPRRSLSDEPLRSCSADGSQRHLCPIHTPQSAHCLQSLLSHTTGPPRRAEADARTHARTQTDTVKKGRKKDDSHEKSRGADRHGAQQRRRQAAPEARQALRAPRLRKAVARARVPAHAEAAICLLRTRSDSAGPLVARRLRRQVEPVGLHAALDDIEGVAGEPQRLAGEAAVQGEAPRLDVAAGGAGAAPCDVARHEPLVGEEPDAVGLGLADGRDAGAAVEAVRDAGARDERARTGDRAGVQALRGRGSVRLRLEADAHVLDRGGEERVGQPGEGAGQVVLRVGEGAGGDQRVRGRGVGGFKGAARVVEGAELDGDLDARWWLLSGALGTCARDACNGAGEVERGRGWNSRRRRCR